MAESQATLSRRYTAPSTTRHPTSLHTSRRTTKNAHRRPKYKYRLASEILPPPRGVWVCMRPDHAAPGGPPGTAGQDGRHKHPPTRRVQHLVQQGDLPIAQQAAAAGAARCKTLIVDDPRAWPRSLQLRRLRNTPRTARCAIAVVHELHDHSGARVAAGQQDVSRPGNAARRVAGRATRLRHPSTRSQWRSRTTRRSAARSAARSSSRSTRGDVALPCDAAGARNGGPRSCPRCP